MRGIDWLPAKLVQRMTSRRGHHYAFETLDVRSTALVVIDMTVLFAGDSSQAPGVVDNINRLAAATRADGGIVAWVRPGPTLHAGLMEAILGSEPAARYRATMAGDPRAALHAGLIQLPTDIHVAKRGYSAFFPGACDLTEQLRARGIDTVLIVGAISNVCCEASARDAFARGFRVVMLADANIGKRDEHQAALAAIYRNYGDVRTTEEVVALLEDQPAARENLAR